MNRIVRNMHEINWFIVGMMSALALIGLLMMISAGGGDIFMYAWPQMVRLVGAFILMLLMAVMPMRWLLDYAYIIFIALVLVLVGVDIAGHIGMGAQRWLKLGGMNVQPSEFMKLALIMALARYFHQLQPEDIYRINFLVPPLLIIIIPAILILKQPNLGTATITVGVGVTMLFLAGLQWRYIIPAIAGAVSAAPVAWHFLHDYQKQRVLTFLDPQKDPLGAGYNILQSMIAVGSGGFFGKGYLQGSQSQLNFLPEKHTDFIFTMLAEEFGFVGTLLLLGLYAGLIIAIMTVANRSKSTFGAMLCGGVAALFFIHMMINCAMVLGLIPVVGVPLPFMSYGGSIMVSSILAVGLVLNAHTHRDQMPVRSQPKL